MSKWFKFKLNKNTIVLVNMDLIGVIEFGLTTVTIGEFELDGDDADRFRREFGKYSEYVEGLVRIER